MPEEKSLSQLTKKELYDKCVENLEIKNEFNKFKEQVNEYKTQLDVRANYIQKLQYERDQLLEKTFEDLCPHQILIDYREKLYKDKLESEEVLKTKADKCNMIDTILESL